MSDATSTERFFLVFGKVVAWVVYAYVVFVEIMLVFRVLLLLGGANPTAGFFQLVFQTTSDAMAPFRGLFPARPVGATGYLDISALFAMVVYLLLAYFIGLLVHYLGHKLQLLRKG